MIIVNPSILVNPKGRLLIGDVEANWKCMGSLSPRRTVVLRTADMRDAIILGNVSDSICYNWITQISYMLNMYVLGIAFLQFIVFRIEKLHALFYQFYKTLLLLPKLGWEDFYLMCCISTNSLNENNHCNPRKSYQIQSIIVKPGQINLTIKARSNKSH